MFSFDNMNAKLTNYHDQVSHTHLYAIKQFPIKHKSQDTIYTYIMKEILYYIRLAHSSTSTNPKLLLNKLRNL